MTSLGSGCSVIIIGYTFVEFEYKFRRNQGGECEETSHCGTGARSGGIIGLGETRTDRYALLQQLATQHPHPESVPINLLVKVAGTPLAEQPETDVLEMVRMIATARLLMPTSMVRLSAGRLSLSDEAQALCFLAGANSIFMGDKLLTTPNPEADRDQTLLGKLGLHLRPGAELAAAQGNR